MYRVLFLGDVNGPQAADYVSSHLWQYRNDNKIDFVVANAENCAQGNGIDREQTGKLLAGGCDILTTGNHVFKKMMAKDMLDENDDIIRPANYPPEVPGVGYTIRRTGKFSILVINVLGVVMMEPLDNPFRTVDKILSATAGKYDISLLDLHAETTSEKNAMAHYLDGRVTMICGTHTHVPTADERILPKGTAYITDAGMCGPDESVLGLTPECIIEKLTKNMPVRFILSDNPVTAHGLMTDIDETTKKAVYTQTIAF
ncbi:MAG: TIGR00282 family metallophosphoesterase [Clostridia bacterium]|nr:TIGR00282 family metallophosphoesterase [Clostridia bacterium]